MLDRFITELDKALRVTSGAVGKTPRPSPALDIEDDELTSEQKTEAARLMRVNHCGEVCAQALYQGQALTARSGRVSNSMQKAANEETDHLSWCESRLKELDANVSVLNPIWYASSFAMGAVAGLLGDKVSLGFVAATEDQVCKHLDEHLEKIPGEDKKSISILEQMREDEAHHKETALNQGGVNFPAPVKSVMTAISGFMTRTTYWV